MAFSENDKEVAWHVYNTTTQIINSPAWKHYNNDRRMKIFARDIGNQIHDTSAGKNWSGYISKGVMYSVVYNGSKIKSCATYEHFNSRQQSGYILIDKVAQNPKMTFEQFLTLFKPLCRTHRTLQSENQALIPYQKQGLHWVDAYQQVGIQLVYVGEDRVVTEKLLRDNIESEPTDLQIIAESMQ